MLANKVNWFALLDIIQIMQVLDLNVCIVVEESTLIRANLWLTTI